MQEKPSFVERKVDFLSVNTRTSNPRCLSLPLRVLGILIVQGHLFISIHVVIERCSWVSGRFGCFCWWGEGKGGLSEGGVTQFTCEQQVHAESVEHGCSRPG